MAGRAFHGWERLRTEIERFVGEQRARRAADTAADACAIRLTHDLEDAILALETDPSGFEQATHKTDHVEELRRLLGILLDVLADWEMLADRDG
jgi:hypothetical protein